MAQISYDVIIVGAGLFGSAAARHASALAKNKRILLIGPAEPKNRNDADIFSAHYDEGRITTRLGNTTALFTKLISKGGDYRDLEGESGLDIFTECGYLLVQPGGEDRSEKSKIVAKELNVPFEEFKTQEARKRFPSISFRPGDIALATAKDAGSFNPRKLIEAQQMLAKRNGCVIVDDVVASITPPPSGDDLHQVVTGQGRLYFGRRILLATGAFTECRDLLPFSLLPDVFNSKQSYVMVEITEDAFAKVFSILPCFSISRNYQGGKKSYYILPPIKYPDGKYYFKIGHAEDEPVEASTPQEIRDWFRCRGDPEMLRHLVRAFHDILPGVTAVNYTTDSCVTTRTLSGLPYIDMVTPDIGVAIGGCGSGAKISDKVGFIAARMILRGEWDHELPKESFKYRIKPTKTRKLAKL